MTQKKGTTLLLILSITLFFLASFVVTTVRAPAGPSYTLGASPTTLNEEEGNVIITFAITGGTANTAYTFRFTVTKPGGAGQAYVDESFPTDATGGYTQVLTYPNNSPSWNAPTGTANTDIPGNYNITVVETAPKSVTTGLPSAKFTVTNVLTVLVITPTQGSIVPRVTNVAFTATVNDVIVNPEQLSVTSIQTYNEYGTPTGDFSPGDTLYAKFTIAYPGGPLTTGSFTIHVQNPSGSTTTTLPSIYDQNRQVFYTPSGFQVSTSDPAGSWELVIPAQSLNDSYGNTGPTTTQTYRFVVHQQQNQVVINPFYYLIAALAIGGSLGITVFLKR